MLMYHAYHETRFSYDARRDVVWQAISRYLVKRGLIEPAWRVLDLGAGYCHFINNVPVAAKYALDLFPRLKEFAAPDVTCFVQQCDEPWPVPEGALDAVFASNLFEHLSLPSARLALAEVRRTLRNRGALILVQPNYRYAWREYFDDYTHLTVFSHVSLVDFCAAEGFECVHIEPRFVPFSMKQGLPIARWLIELYLRLPLRPMAKQMLVVLRKQEVPPPLGGREAPAPCPR